MNRRPVLLIIFDGFGLNPNRLHNGWALARTPHLDEYFATNPHTALQASGLAVGLPDGQFGNSEVGHLTLGAGKILEQELVRITEVIRAGGLAANPAWQGLLKESRRVHLIGMVSDGGVHSHIEHMLGILMLLNEAGVTPVIHMITDGRDTPPKSALRFLTALEQRLAEEPGTGHIATVSGRYFAMDRAKHWDRTQKAWSVMVLGQGLHAGSPHEAIEAAYDRGEGDEFIQPTVIGSPSTPVMAPDEPVFFFNFRSDRMRQLAAAMGLEVFSPFARNTEPHRVVCMTEYNAQFPFPVIFSPTHPEKVLAEVISDAGLKQFHCAEQEKYPHVTYFFNGGREKPFNGEEREIIPSPDVATYDLKPEMSAPQVADRIIQAIEADRYDFILVNFANADMVGHTAIRPAIIEAVETLDRQSHRVIQAALKRNYYVLLTADHGNCDEMVDPATGEPHTQHTVYPVPFLLLGDREAQLGIGRGLSDVAPTVLDLLSLPQPPQMTGCSLIL
ncbi:MAG: 2,3-bisphosphoglycerate-independent phosphoglycerate mutase [Xanthomonadales bacterium]|nr:2,3-bisphosphoglycerate-independent phosphoglycerate mutase [Xanthomonadales bacterium]